MGFEIVLGEIGMDAVAVHLAENASCAWSAVPHMANNPANKKTTLLDIATDSYVDPGPSAGHHVLMVVGGNQHNIKPAYHRW